MATCDRLDVSSEVHADIKADVLDMPPWTLRGYKMSLCEIRIADPEGIRELHF